MIREMECELETLFSASWGLEDEITCPLLPTELRDVFMTFLLVV
jgi:hypothetical protein